MTTEAKQRQLQYLELNADNIRLKITQANLEHDYHEQVVGLEERMNKNYSKMLALTETTIDELKAIQTVD